MSEEELVRGLLPRVAVVTRNDARRVAQYRVIHTGPDGLERPLGQWCFSESGAWRSAWVRVKPRLLGGHQEGGR